MVFKLSEICIRSICSGIENGQINGQHLSILPPSNPNDPSKSLRQRILDWILAGRKIKNQNCISALASTEFLDGLNSISTMEGQVNDREFLDRLANSLGFMGENGQSIGSGISNLELIIFGAYNPRNKRGESRNFRSVVNVIASCPNLRSLSLKVDRSNIINRYIKWKWKMTFFDDGYVGDGLLNQLPELRPCLSIFENLDSLSLNCDCQFVLGSALPFIKFKNLSKFSISFAEAQNDVWLEFVESIQDSLVTFHVEELRPIHGFGGLIPDFTLFPKLEEFKFAPAYSDQFIPRDFFPYMFEWSLADLPEEIKRISMTASVSNELPLVDRGVLDLFSNTEISIEFQLTAFDRDYVLGSPRRKELDPEDMFKMLADPPRFEMVDLLKEKITTIHFQLNTWKLEYAAAFEHFVDVCTNLTGFDFGVLNPKNLEVQPDLSVLFNNVERARKLRYVQINGDVYFGQLFDNCTNLDTLRFMDNRLVNDDHLIDWVASGGGRLQEFSACDCPEITERGVVAILVNSGTKLKKFYCGDKDHRLEDEERIKRAMAEYCPFKKEELYDFYDMFKKGLNMMNGDGDSDDDDEDDDWF